MKELASDLAVIAGGIFFFHAFLTMLLALPLKGRFDSAWEARTPRAFGRPLFNRYMLTVKYAASVVSKRAARNTFHDESYDFRGRVGPFLYLACLVSFVAGLVGMALGLVAFILAIVAGEQPWRRR
jgi:hypothetical protein